MKVYHGVKDFVPPKNPVVTTGTFDGVHCGHLEILNRLKTIASQNDGETVVVSFDPHPRTVIHPHIETKLIHTIEEKINRLERAGIDHFIIIPFNMEFARTSSLEFVRDILIRAIQTKFLVIGYDHQFGRNREGSIQDLEEYAMTYDFQIEQIPAQTFEDINISSTKIRKALEAGDIETANVYLGYDFLVSGNVIHGNKMGHALGYPTANIDLHSVNKMIPKLGVYAVEVKIGDRKFGGMLNIGSKPTLTDGVQQSIEVNIFDFNEDIYGQRIEIRLKKRIRSEQKFSGKEELEIQLGKDKVSSLAYLRK